MTLSANEGYSCGPPLLRGQVQYEAELSMALLDSKADDGFQQLLMTPKPMIRAFDHVVQ